MAPAVTVAAAMISTMCERGSLRVSRARCWAVESKVMNEASVGFEADGRITSVEYATAARISA